MIIGVVLAAGRSRRMGAPKPLLAVDEQESFLEHVISALRDGGCDDVYVVVGPEHDAAAREIGEAVWDAGAHRLINPLADTQQVDSLRVAIRSLPPQAEALIETPVDFPRIQAATVRKLIDAFEHSHAPVVVPTYQGRHGHPTLFARSLWPELLADPLPEGARTVVHAHRGDLLEVRVEDAGVLLDVDTPEDYTRLMQE
jgi:CTP:molybdopterin cytidylyltransferase MocA